MYDLKWSNTEKKIARRAFEHALAAELSDVMTEFKARAAAATEPDDMWSMETYLYRKRREIDQRYDYRYSQLPIVFARLLREGRLHAEQLDGLSADKLARIRYMASL